MPIEAESVANTGDPTNTVNIVVDGSASAGHAVEVTCYDWMGWGVEALSSAITIPANGDYSFTLSVMVMDPSCPDEWFIDVMVNGQWSGVESAGFGGTAYGAGYAPLTLGPVTGLLTGDVISFRAYFSGVSTDSTAGGTSTVQAEDYNSATATETVVTPSGHNGTGAIKDTQDPWNGTSVLFDRDGYNSGLITPTCEGIPITADGWYDITLRMQWHGIGGDSAVNTYGIVWPHRGIMWASPRHDQLGGTVAMDTWATMTITDVPLLNGDTLEPSIFYADQATQNRYAIIDEATIAQTGGFVLDTGAAALRIDTVEIAGGSSTHTVGPVDVTGAGLITISAARHVHVLSSPGDALAVTGTGQITISGSTHVHVLSGSGGDALDVTGAGDINIASIFDLGGTVNATATIQVSRDGGPWEDIGNVETYTWNDPAPGPGIHTICFRAVINGVPQPEHCCTFTIIGDDGQPPPPVTSDCDPNVGPILRVELAFGTQPGDQLDLATWTDVTPYVRELSTRRGRQHELDQFDTGTASVRFKNRDRRFDPTNTASPYAPYLQPETPIRVYAWWCGTLYWVFTGYVERWPPLRNGPRDSTVEVTASDGFDLLANQEYNQFLAPRLAGDRINQLLDLAEWPAAMRRTATGVAPMQGRAAQIGVYDGVLASMQEAATAEQGQLYMAADGDVVFEDRHARLGDIASQAILGDQGDGSEVPYKRFEGELARDEIRNHIVCTIAIPDGLSGTPAPQEVIDDASRAQYQKRTYELSDLALASDLEALELAQWLLIRYATPHFRITALETTGQMDWALVGPTILGLEISSRLTVMHRPPGGGTPNPLQIDGYVEAVEHHITADGLPLRWETSWVVSPAESLDYWILEDPVFGLLGVTTRLAP